MAAGPSDDTVRPGAVLKREVELDLLDPYIAEKVVARKEADLRVEARESALRSALTRESGPALHAQWIRAIRLAGRLVRRSATLASSGGAKRAAALGKADR